MRRVDPRSLAAPTLQRELHHACRQAELASLAAGIATGRQRKRLERVAGQHGRNALALADALYGPCDPATLAMDDAALLAELAADLAPAAELPAAAWDAARMA